MLWAIKIGFIETIFRVSRLFFAAGVGDYWINIILYMRIFFNVFFNFGVLFVQAMVFNLLLTAF
jgi:hypothetical protein